MSVAPSLKQMQEAGFMVGGEPLVALDLVDTLMTAVDPTIDLWGTPQLFEAWWDLQSGRLPEGRRPDRMPAFKLRASIREVLDAQIAGRSAEAVAVDDINAATSAVPTSMRLVVTPDGRLAAHTRWRTEYGGHPALAHIAGEVVGLLSDPASLQRLRRCANPECSMLFLAVNSRRRWCADNICGNRARVARHYARTRPVARVLPGRPPPRAAPRGLRCTRRKLCLHRPIRPCRATRPSELPEDHRHVPCRTVIARFRCRPRAAAKR